MYNSKNIFFSEWLKRGDIWEEIKLIEDFDFFTIATTDQLNNMLKLQYGCRIVYRTYEDIEIITAAQMLVIINSTKWNGLTSVFEKGFDFTSDETEKTDTVETIDKGVVNNGVINNKVAGFNSTNLIIESGNDNNNSEDENTIKTLGETKTKNNINNLNNNLKIIDKNNIIPTVLCDVSNYLTLEVY